MLQLSVCCWEQARLLVVDRAIPKPQAETCKDEVHRSLSLLRLRSKPLPSNAHDVGMEPNKTHDSSWGKHVAKISAHLMRGETSSCAKFPGPAEAELAAITQEWSSFQVGFFFGLHRTQHETGHWCCYTCCVRTRATNHYCCHHVLARPIGL